MVRGKERSSFVICFSLRVPHKSCDTLCNLAMSREFVTLKCSLGILTIIWAAALVARASFSDEDKTKFVLAHNRLRETAFPSAAGMQFVIWDDNLERLAVDAAKKCVFEHYDKGEYASLGENIYKGYRTNPHEITLGWYSEKGAYNEAITSCVGCGHYTQVMTAAVTKIGCGIQRDCENKQGNHMVFCEYNVGNGYFAKGPACSACPATMPLCLNGLCVNKELAGDKYMKAVDSTVTTVADFKCNLVCKNCGKLDTATCKCDCSSTGGATGDTCEKKSASSAVTCSPCTGSPPCLNNGTEDSSDPLKCKCKCPTGFLGNRCETPQGQFNNSVKLVLAAASEFKFVNWVIMPPVSRSLFNTEIWAILKTELAKAVNTFCGKDATNFEKCCPGKKFPADTSTINTAEHVTAGDFKFIESSVGHKFDTFNLLVFAKVSSSSKMCTDPAYLPSLALLPAIQSAQTVISARLTACCGNSTLKEVASTSLNALVDPIGLPTRSGLPSQPSKGADMAARPYKYLWLLLVLSIKIWR